MLRSAAHRSVSSARIMETEVPVNAQANAKAKAFQIFLPHFRAFTWMLSCLSGRISSVPEG